MNILPEKKDISTLENLKDYRYSLIDAKTSQMIGAGFTFDGNLFSLSTAAQSNWTNIKASKTTFAAMGLFPIQISTKDNNLYSLAETNVDAFWGAGLGVVKNAYNSGGDLKKLIFDATTIEEVNAIIDNR